MRHPVAGEAARRLSIYIPRSKRRFRPIERMKRLARKRKCSVNGLVVEAILEYLRHEEGKA